MGMLLRRHRKDKPKEQPKQEPQEPQIELESLSFEEIKEHTNADIKARLDKLEIEYKSNDKKDTLISLLGVEVPKNNEDNQEPPNDENESQNPEENAENNEGQQNDQTEDPQEPTQEPKEEK